MEEFLAPAYYIDSNHPKIKETAIAWTKGIIEHKEKAITLFTKVRDHYYYTPYLLDLRKEAMKASHILTKSTGYCIEKALLLAALLRAVDIPSRVHFGDVSNHIATDRITIILKTNKLAFHACTEIYLDHKWVKATPAFNAELCHKLGVDVLDFDGEHDAIFQAYDQNNNLFMEYVHEYGAFTDLPYELYLQQLNINYPHITIPENMILDLLAL